MKRSILFGVLALVLIAAIAVYAVEESSWGKIKRTLGDRESTRMSDSPVGPMMKPGSGTIAPGVIHWWPGDGNANDIIGGIDGSLMDGAGFATGQVGQAFSFDGDFDFVSVPGTFGGGTEATVDAWVKTEGITGDFQAIIIGENTVGTDFVHLQLHYGGNNVAYVNPGWIDLPIIFPEPTGVFRHIALSIKSGETILYVDGEIVGSSTKTFTSIKTTDELKIGEGGAYLRLR